MDYFYADVDHYTYPGSFVLINRLGIKDQERLDRAEKLLVSARLLDVSGIPRTFDYTRFRALHFHMFQDLYDWLDASVMSSSARAARFSPRRCTYAVRPHAYSPKSARGLSIIGTALPP